ncbi:MAG: glucose-1-phosphate thymidylyltransferase RfbA [Nanoarchaeota archaeon]
MKGIVLAGGKGTRLYPMTKTICKQLLPIYDKPMIYYPLSTLMMGKIRNILIISTPNDTKKFEELLGDGSDLGMKFSYKIQEKPKGIAEAFIVGEDFIKEDNCCLILGDNLFYGHGLSEMLEKSSKKEKGATIFGYLVDDPKRYGVVEFDKNKKVLSIEEKPKNPKSKYAVAGIYFYDNKVIKMAKKLKPYNRGELEITDINNKYLEKGNLEVEIMGRGFAWLDTGTYDSMAEAGEFVKTIQKRQGLKIGCIEEIAWRNGFITDGQLKELVKKNYLKKSEYGNYLLNLIGQGSVKFSGDKVRC